MMDEKITDQYGILNTFKYVEQALIQSTVNIQYAEAAITIGRLDLGFPPDKAAYDRLLLQRSMLLVIAGSNICLS